MPSQSFHEEKNAKHPKASRRGCLRLAHPKLGNIPEPHRRNEPRRPARATSLGNKQRTCSFDVFVNDWHQKPTATSSVFYEMLCRSIPIGLFFAVPRPHVGARHPRLGQPLCWWPDGACSGGKHRPPSDHCNLEGARLNATRACLLLLGAPKFPAPVDTLQPSKFGLIIIDSSPIVPQPSWHSGTLFHTVHSRPLESRRPSRARVLAESTTRTQLRPERGATRPDHEHLDARPD